MSKELGQKIAIKFTEILSGDVTGLVPEPITWGDYFRPIGTATHSSVYSSYPSSNCFDGNPSSYWYTRSTGEQWVQIQLAEPVWTYGFRWYVGSSYRPNGFNFQGSNDGSSWEIILSSNSPNAAGWYEFKSSSPKHYQYYRWVVTSRHSSYLYIHEIQLLKAAGNEEAFSIVGNEHQYVNGPLLLKEYKAISVERHPDYTDNKHLLITFHPQSRFNNVEGFLTVQYNPAIGSLRGRGGPVEGFTIGFLPIGLMPKPNPGVDESLIAVANTILDFLLINYAYRYTEDTLAVSATMSIVFTYVGTVNP